MGVEGEEGVDELGKSVAMVGRDGKVLPVERKRSARVGGHVDPSEAHLPPQRLG
jgi:hypothetical protein